MNGSTCVIVPFVTYGNGLFFTFAEFLSSVGVILALGTLSKTMPSVRRDGQLFKLISLSLNNTYQLNKLATTSC